MDRTELIPETLLWNAVLQQMIVDATSLARSGYEAKERRDSRDMILNMRPDFIRVCDLAGANPVEIKNTTEECLKIGVVARFKREVCS